MFWPRLCSGRGSDMVLCYIWESQDLEQHLNIWTIHYLNSHCLVHREETKTGVECLSKKAEERWFLATERKKGLVLFDAWVIHLLLHRVSRSLMNPGMNSVQCLRNIYFPSMLSYPHLCFLNSFQSQTAQFLFPDYPHQNNTTTCEIDTTKFI